MIEARNKISSTPAKRRGPQGAKGFSAEGYPLSRTDMPGPQENILRTVAPFMGAESCQTIAVQAHEKLCHEQYLLCS